MLKYLLQTVDIWRSATAQGSDAILHVGYASTRREPGDCNPGWFPTDSTVILGLEARTGALPPTTTLAEWRIFVPHEYIRRANKTLLVIASKREQAGLHSMKRDALTRIKVNDLPVDMVGVWTPPPSGADFWYRQYNQIKLPNVDVLEDCGNIYVWSVDRSHLLEDRKHQIVSVEMDPELNWDIDLVGLLLRVPTRHAHPALWALALAVVSAILGALMAKLI